MRREATWRAVEWAQWRRWTHFMTTYVIGAALPCITACAPIGAHKHTRYREQRQTISQKLLSIDDQVETRLNQGKMFLAWLGIRVYEPVRQENGEIG